jgi:3-hydroxyacyl-[acyl-carrier-protein] dehydratase
MRLEYFEMIDRVVEIDHAAGRIRALAQVPGASPVFEGHFPGRPLLPGVLMTETMAQASGYLLLSKMKFAQMPFLMGVDKARFRDFVGPQAMLEVTAEIEHEGSGYSVTKAAIASGGKRIAEAGLRFRIMPFPAELGHLMIERARGIGLEA